MAAHNQHEHHDHNEQRPSDLIVGMTGLGIGIVFILIVATFAHWLAL